MAYTREQLPETISGRSPLDEGLPEAYAEGLRQLLQHKLSSKTPLDGVFGVLFTLFIYGLAFYVVSQILFFVLVFLFVIHPAFGVLGILGVLYLLYKLIRLFFRRKLTLRQRLNSMKAETMDVNLEEIGDAILEQIAIPRGWQKVAMDESWLASVHDAYPFRLRVDNQRLPTKLHITFAYEHPEHQIQMIYAGKQGQSIPCLMLRMPCHKSMLGTTVAVMDMGWMRHGGGTLRWALKRVGLVSSEFEKMFEVFSDDQVEGRTMMTPDIMQRLLDHVKEQVVLTGMMYPLDEPERAFELKKGFWARMTALFNTPMLVFKDEHLLVLYRHPLHPFYPLNVPNDMDPANPIRLIWRRLRMIEGLREFYFPNR